MNDAEIREAYASWTVEELFDHHDACLAEAEVQRRWGLQKQAAECRRRAKQYGRALGLRGVRP